MDSKLTKLKGKVISKPFSPGSKSEHDAIYLQVGKKNYKLKRQGGNPFHDEELNKLVNKSITASGLLTDYFFEMGSYKENIIKKK